MAKSSSTKERSCCICLNELGSQSKDARGSNICGGCEQRFCNRHYKDHRADIDKEFGKLGEEHDLLVEHLNSISSVDLAESPLIKEINRWEAETIDKVRLAADSARKDVAKLMKQDEEIVKNQLKSFTDELREKESAHEYDETDIEEIKLKLNKLQQQIRHLSNEKIQVEYQEINWDTMVLANKTDNHPSPLNQVMRSGLNRVHVKEYFCDTTLLTHEQQIVLNKFYGTSNQLWKLLYKATRNGFKPEDFHRCCDKKGPTMTVYRDSTSRYLFGGFTMVDWTSPYLDASATPNDSHAFLFTLTNPHSLAPTKFPIYNDKVTAAYHTIEFGPSFGLKDCYSDIYYNDQGECHVYFPRSYIDTTNLNYGPLIFTGSDCFRLSEIEVYTLL